MLLGQTNHCNLKRRVTPVISDLESQLKKKTDMSHNSKEIPGYHFYLGSGHPLPIPTQPADIFSLISLMTDSSNTLSEIPRQQSLYFKLECLWVKFYTIADNGLRKMTVTVDGSVLGS